MLYLYQRELSRVIPFDERVYADHPASLVKIDDDGLGMIKAGLTIDDVIARMATKAAPTASVTVETDNVPSESPKTQEAVSESSATNEEKDPAPKGVVVIGKVEKPTADEFQFEDTPKDYTGYCIYSGDIFPVENLPSVPDTELVRFAKEVLKRNYEDASVIADDVERANYYLELRNKIAKALSRINKKRLAKKAAKEAANDGDND